jgi:hypothetical protein
MKRRLTAARFIAILLVIHEGKQRGQKEGWTTHEEEMKERVKYGEWSFFFFASGDNPRLYLCSGLLSMTAQFGFLPL